MNPGIHSGSPQVSFTLLFPFLQGQFSLDYIKAVRVNGPLKEANGPKCNFMLVHPKLNNEAIDIGLKITMADKAIHHQILRIFTRFPDRLFLILCLYYS